ncbi:anhydro-N-acetylmuramic acid kinase [Pelagibacterales bacterium SAG-MED19]|nr:anhydro-N-acetylmuramic acid kinase [Pelagibacterales bacterium SAG-MED19]
MKKEFFTSLGLMSGTSMDGVDISLIKSDGYDEYISILDDYYEFNYELRQNLINLRDKIFTLEDLKKNSLELADFERKFTLFIGQIVKKIQKNYDKKIDLIGFHGQTIFHNPEQKISKQVGDGELLSQVLGKTVINDFRQQDILNGGQGAPLTPIFHKLISKFLEKKHKLILPFNIINIGGIANITKIYKENNSKIENLQAFDIAPGNCLIDEWIRKNSDNKFDKNGQIAKSGKVNDLILNQALDNFDIQKYDKSLDIKNFDISFAKGLSLEDGCATITKFTAHLIAKGIEFVNNLDKKISTNTFVCGGGRKNTFLIDSINENLVQSNFELEDLDLYGFNGDFIESQAFGYLAIRSFLKLPISFPKTTRCKSAVTGGKINKIFQ